MKKNFIGKIFTQVLCALGAFFVVSEYEKNELKIVKYSVSSDKIKEKYRFVFLSDMHSKEFGKDNERLIKMTETLKPDAVLIGGDMLCSGPSFDRTQILSLCRKLCQRYPVYYGNGNHELRMRTRDYGITYEAFVEELQEAGVKYLSNSKCKLAPEIDLYGLDISGNFYRKLKFDRMKKDFITESIGNSDKKRYNILLAHSPNFFDAYSDWGADLSLAGHFHGGTVRLPGDIGLMTPQMQFFSTNVVGIKSRAKSRMIISAGLGTHTVNVRINNRPELVCVDLLPA